MKKFEITEEQIKELAKGNKKVEKMFPEVFENKLELNKWYVLKSSHINYLLFFNGSDIAYGFMDGTWGGDWFFSKEGNQKCSNIRLATEEEVKSALVKEAEIRGYAGSHIKIIQGFNKGKKSLSETIDVFDFEARQNRLMSNVYTVFKDGEWAEIIKSKYLTKKQAEEKLSELSNDGYEYQIID